MYALNKLVRTKVMVGIGKAAAVGKATGDSIQPYRACPLHFSDNGLHLCADFRLSDATPFSSCASSSCNYGH